MPAAKRYIDTIAPPVVKALDLLIAAMDEAQQIHHNGTVAEMMWVADEVVQRNDPLARIATSLFMLGDFKLRVIPWSDSTKRFSANDASNEADRLADAVVDRDSTDGFIRNRSSIPKAAEQSRTEFGFAHFGGTLLGSDKRRWVALDATTRGGFVTCTWVVPCPYPPFRCNRVIHEASNGLTPFAYSLQAHGMSDPFGIGDAPSVDPCVRSPKDGPRIRIQSEAVVRMQSPFFRRNL